MLDDRKGLTSVQIQGLVRLGDTIRNNVGAQDWGVHISDCCFYVAAALGLTEKQVGRFLTGQLMES